MTDLLELCDRLDALVDKATPKNWRFERYSLSSKWFGNVVGYFDPVAVIHHHLPFLKLSERPGKSINAASAVCQY